MLCYSYKEAVAALGYADEWEKYTLAEVIKTHFALFNMAPIVLVNVLDPAKHKENVQDKQTAMAGGIVTMTEPVLLDTLKVKTHSGASRTREGYGLYGGIRMMKGMSSSRRWQAAAFRVGRRNSI